MPIIIIIIKQDYFGRLTFFLSYFVITVQCNGNVKV